MKKYQPSNGSEETWFTNKYCMNCKHCDPDPEGEKQCDILCATLVFNTNDPEYPEEWRYNESGAPICTKFSYWDWGKDGDPPEPVFDNPNQLKLF